MLRVTRDYSKLLFNTPFLTPYVLPNAFHNSGSPQKTVNTVQSLEFVFFV
jgi:hypothetical protein